MPTTHLYWQEQNKVLRNDDVITYGVACTRLRNRAPIDQQRPVIRILNQNLVCARDSYGIFCRPLFMLFRHNLLL